MAGKTNTSATFFAQKKLLGKAHTSNLKVDGEEVIGSNIQSSTGLLFGEPIPKSPAQTLYALQSATGSTANTIEYIEFVLTALTGTTYDANNTGGGAGSDSGESSQVSGPHAYKFVLPSNYTSASSNPRKGNGIFDNSKLVHETLGELQLVPPFYSQAAPNPYIVKIYKDDGGSVGDEIPLLDNVDWNVDYYNGILFLQDFDSAKIPAFARAFAYVGKMAQEVIASGSGGGGSGDTTAEYVLTKATDSLPNAKIIEAGTGISITTGSNSITVSSTIGSINGRSKTTYFVTGTHAIEQPLVIAGVDFSTVAYDQNKIDINLNGQLLHTGSLTQVESGDRDYFLNTTGSVVFATDLFEDDIVDVIISVVGGGGGGGDGDSTASYLVLSNTGSLSNERSFVAGTGLLANDGGSNSNYTLRVNDSIVATLTSSATFSNGISGSLTHLADGSSYIVAGDNITIVSGSTGAITINSTVSVPTRKKATYDVTSFVSSGSVFATSDSKYSDAGFDPNAIDVFLNGQLLMSGTNAQVGLSQADYFVASNTSLKFGFDVSIEDVVNVVLTPTSSTGAGGGGGGSGATHTAGTGLNLIGTEFSVDNSIFASLTGSIFSGHVGVTGSLHSTAEISGSILRAPVLTGSLTKLEDGSSFIIAGNNIQVVSGSSGAITISSTDTNTQLSQEQVEDFAGALVATGGTKTGIAVTYDDANGNMDFVVDDLTVAGDSGNTPMTPGDTLTIAGGTNVTTAMSGDTLTINATDTNTEYTAGTGLSLIGTQFRVNDSIVPTLTSSVVFSNGISGSLTHLADGSSYLVAGENITITTASVGSVFISSVDNNTTYTAGDGLSLVGTEFSVDDSIVATLSGSQFSGNVGITGSLGIESQTIFNAGIHEKFNTKTGATGVVVHDCSSGHIFYHTSLSANFTANFTNLDLLTTYGTNVTLVLVQGATARIPTAVQIGGAAQSLLWQGGSPPSGTNNGTDVVSFSILNNSGTFIVLGQLVGFS